MEQNNDYNWKEIISKDKRYKDFEIAEDPKPFSIYFMKNDIPLVQVHSVSVLKAIKSIVGFCGAFEWKDNHLTSLDHDSYNKDMVVLGYKWFEDKKLGKCLDILVGDDW